VLYDVPTNGGGGSDDYQPWTWERFRPGDRVSWTAKAIRSNIPTKSRREIKGRVTKTDVGVNGATWTVHVLWDGYKRPHSYAGCFITKVK
jgi:hypothetical protein